MHNKSLQWIFSSLCTIKTNELILYSRNLDDGAGINKAEAMIF